MRKITEYDKEKERFVIPDEVLNKYGDSKVECNESPLKKNTVVISSELFDEIVQRFGEYENDCTDDKENTVNDLIELQNKLDECICVNNNNEKVGTWNKELAFNVEFGEFMNEIPTTFKHWKKTALDNREKALEEYVDMLHFLLSWTYDILCDDNEDASDVDVDSGIHSYDEVSNGMGKYKIKNKKTTKGEEILKAYNHIVIEGFNEKDIEEVFFGMFMIGIIVEFTWDEIYSAYTEKNLENYRRIQRGY